MRRDRGLASRNLYAPVGAAVLKHAGYGGALDRGGQVAGGDDAAELRPLQSDDVPL